MITIMVKTKNKYFLKDLLGWSLSWYLHENTFFILNVIDVAIGIVVEKKT